MDIVKTWNIPCVSQMLPLEHTSSLLSQITPPLTAANLISISTMFSFQKCHINGIMYYVTFWAYRFSLSQILWGFHVGCCMYQ